MMDEYDVEKTALFFDPYVDEEEFVNNHLEVEYIVDLMWAYGYTITERDAYRAWVHGNAGVWEHPFEYSDQIIVAEVLAQCGVETRHHFTEADAISNPFFDEWLESELEDYEPVTHAKLEGFSV